MLQSYIQKQKVGILSWLKQTWSKKPYGLPSEVIHHIIQFIPFSLAASLGANERDLSLIASYQSPRLHTHEFLYDKPHPDDIILHQVLTIELDWFLKYRPQQVFDYLNSEMTVSPLPSMAIHVTKLIHFMKYDRLDLFQLLFPLHHSKLLHLEGFTSMAAYHGKQEFLVCLHSIRPVCLIDPFFSTLTMDLAARKGNTHICRYLHETRREGCTTQAMDWAAMGGYLDTVKFLHENRKEGCTKSAMDESAANGHFSIVQFLHHHRNEGCTTRAMDEAATNGYLEIVKFLNEHRSEASSLRAMDLAAYSGHLQVVQYLLEHLKEPCQSFRLKTKDESTGTKASSLSSFKDGHMSLYNFLHEQDEQAGHSLALVYATGRHHYPIIEYLAQYATEDAFTDAVNYTAENGHLDMFKLFFKYLTSAHIARALFISSYHGHTDMMNYIILYLPDSFHPMALQEMKSHQILIPDHIENETEQTIQDQLVQFDRLKSHLLYIIKYKRQIHE